MVLGLRSKKKKGASAQIDYAVHVEEIKPWPPSESLKSVQSVLLQWQNGDQSSGSFITVAGDANIVFNESFTLPFILRRQKKAHDKFQKNILEFSLYEPRKDKGTKQQLLGTAVINIAEFGIIEDIITIAVPVSCKKSSKNSMQPELFVHIEPLDKGSSKSSPNIRSSRTSLDDGQESLADLDDDESEIASFTDDDISSHSSQTLGSSTAKASPSHKEKGGPELGKAIAGQENSNKSLPPVHSVNLSSDTVNSHNSKPRFSERSMTLVQEKPIAPSIQSSSSFTGYRDLNGKSKNQIEHIEQGAEVPGFNKEGKTGIKDLDLVKEDKTGRVPQNIKSSSESSKERKNSEPEATLFDDEYLHLMGVDEEPVDKSSIESMKRQATMRNANSTSKGVGTQFNSGRLKHVKSELHDTSGRNGFFGKSYNTEKETKVRSTDAAAAATVKSTQLKKEIAIESSNRKARTTAETERNKMTNEFPKFKDEWELKIKMLEEELRETATLEVALYSVVAEHGSSANKVHTPARRLSRFYLHACKAKSIVKQASAARAAISGLLLVSKACGNDVPRLTFWLSNTIMLRAIISQTASKIPHSRRGPPEKVNGRLSLSKSSTSSKIDYASSIEINPLEESDGWEDIDTFLFALERTESWIFSRIIESIWWQTLTPHMQTTVAKSGEKSKGTSTKKSSASKYGLGDQDQGNFSIELWKKAFRDACERLCPIRAEGHECGCLPLTTKLVMEQLVIRLDVAMFNAILRESAEDMPSDPISDPISDPRVLPILAGNLSFGAGAQLKNAIGNWSRWLSDFFDVQENDPPEDNDVLADKEPESFKPFRLLNALSDVMMLPFEMFTDKATRREVCPLLGATLIRQVLCNFVPDQFCPYPIPENVIESLDDEDDIDASSETITSHPCTAPPTVYSPPPVTLLANFIREVGNHTVQRSGSSLLKKSYTSDDELDELDTRLTCIITDNSWRISAPRKDEHMPKGNGSRKVARYQLLREVWKDYEE